MCARAWGADDGVRDFNKREGVGARVRAEEFIDGEVIVGITCYYVRFFGDEISKISELHLSYLARDTRVGCRLLVLMYKKRW